LVSVFQTDLGALAVAEPEIRSCGASIVAIAHQTAPNSNGKFQRENGIRFPILHDEGDVAVAYGIRWSPQELALMEAQPTAAIIPMTARSLSPGLTPPQTRTGSQRSGARGAF
jgi:peroxiredoxin